MSRELAQVRGMRLASRNKSGRLGMKRKMVVASVLASIGFLAFAQSPAPSGPAVSLETLQITKAKGGWQDEAAGAGGYSMLSKTSAMGMMGKTTITTNARFQKDSADPKAKPEQLLKAKCTMKGEVNTPLWSGAFGVTMETRRFSTIYACQFEGAGSDAYNLEIAMPPDKSSAVTPGGIMTVQVQRNKPEDYLNAFVARLMYKGKLYTAQPVGIDPLKYDTRMMKGFTFSRDGAQVGGMEFVGGARDKGSIQAPPATSEDREAVIFLALSLLHMPDSSSQIIQSMKYAPH